jgi:hypothetical protein
VSMSGSRRTQGLTRPLADSLSHPSRFRSLKNTVSFRSFGRNSHAPARAWREQPGFAPTRPHRLGADPEPGTGMGSITFRRLGGV